MEIFNLISYLHVYTAILEWRVFLGNGYSIEKSTMHPCLNTCRRSREKSGKIQKERRRVKLKSFEHLERRAGFCSRKKQ